jgi:hypothetical protein
MAPLTALIYVLEHVRQKKCFCASVLSVIFFKKIVYVTTGFGFKSGSESKSDLFCWIRIRPKLMDSFGFGFESLTLDERGGVSLV